MRMRISIDVRPTSWCPKKQRNKAIAIAKRGLQESVSRSFIVVSLDSAEIARTAENPSPVGMKNSFSISHHPHR